MVAGGGNKLPYGTLPRLLLALVCTEAVRTQSPELVLGDSLSEFMRRLGIYSTSGGTTGGRTRLRNQMRRLFGCMVSLTYADASGEATINAPIARTSEFWWSESQPDARSLWESKIELGEDFFNEVITNPVPLDMHILKSLSRSPLGLDLYLWLTYRTFTLKRPLRLTWSQLYRQFGADPARAGPALSDCHGRARHCAVAAAYRTVATAPRGIVTPRSWIYLPIFPMKSSRRPSPETLLGFQCVTTTLPSAHVIVCTRSVHCAEARSSGI